MFSPPTPEQYENNVNRLILFQIDCDGIQIDSDGINVDSDGINVDSDGIKRTNVQLNLHNLVRLWQRVTSVNNTNKLKKGCIIYNRGQFININTTMCSLNETELPNELRTIQAACSFTISVVGTFGNAMSLILVCRGRIYRASPVTMLIIDLCVANVISTGFIMPIIFFSSFYNWWPLSGIFCKLFGYIIYVALCSECMIIANLALCHYLAVVHHVQIKKIIFNNRIYFRLFLLLGLPWVIAASCFLIPLTETLDSFDYDYRFGYCTLLNKHVFGMEAITGVFLTSTMSVIILYCYPAILYTYIKSRSMTRRISQPVAVGRKSHSKKLHFMISTIMINYLVTYLPYMIVSIIDPCVIKTPLSGYTVVMYFCWSHVAINPFIYALLNTRIKALWRDAFQCLQSATVSKSSSSNLVVMSRRENRVCMKASEDLVEDNNAK